MSDANWQEEEVRETAPPRSADTDELIKNIIAEWDAMNPATRPVLLETHVASKTIHAIPRAIEMERLYKCGREWIRQTHKKPPRRETSVDIEYYRDALDVLHDTAVRNALRDGKTPPDRESFTTLREIVKFFLDETGFLKSHGQLISKYANEDKSPPSVRAEQVRKLLDDPEVRRILNEEAQTNKDRRAASKARVVHAELAAQQRELEKELRDMANAKTPFEATVKAVLDLNKAAQFVHAVGECSGDLLQPEEVLDALDDLMTAIVAAREKYAPITDTDHADVIDGEAWQAQSRRAIC